jgi:hypothetical protein
VDGAIVGHDRLSRFARTGRAGTLRLCGASARSAVRQRTPQAGA